MKSLLIKDTTKEEWLLSKNLSETMPVDATAALQEF